MNELQEAYAIKTSMPEAYRSLCQAGEISRSVQEFIRLRLIAKSHGVSVLELLKTPPWLVSALEKTR